MDMRSRRSWLFDLAILIGSWAFLGLLHPVSKVFWLKLDWIIYHDRCRSRSTVPVRRSAGTRACCI